MFVGQARSLPKTAPFAWDMALLTNIRVGLKHLPGTDTLAYEEHSKITLVKSVITLDPGLILSV
jgi:hypothetical protein